ncbi:SDR family NAD(P)-dependent oxidoreductase [Chryseobacterium sp.]|uniref:SDR family NAD(P)-dependent oxidoreductase n=1 Tax=Chryseobacterium sp. TaxID=1871047 RepID=UPI0025C3A41D|nr:SDR family NAD(P)-dependent oxidoreductase [Chryseobacterium sp.]
MNTKKVWLVTGASKGLGLALVKKLLNENYRVAATSRSVESLVSKIGDISENFLPIELNLTDDTAVKSTIAKIISHFGQLDVVVNNAGYGQIGTLEELSDKEARTNFDINVFGTLNIIRNTMPYFREQKSGHIFNISSVGGFSASFPGWGIYCSTKFAVAGLTESLSEEAKSFGIHATVVYPGYFRTDFLSKDSAKTPEHPIAAYEEARNSEQAHLDQINGNQPNDPEKAAEVLISISKEENPPLHLLLGIDAYDILKNKTDIMLQAAEQWKNYTLSTAL